MGKHNLALVATAADSMATVGHRHRQWRLHHTQLEEAVANRFDVFDKFIAASATSKDACSARLLESKRVLDGLLKEVRSLSVQVKSAEEVLEIEEENLVISNQEIASSRKIHKEKIAACTKQVEQALADYKRYTAELHELRQ